VPYCAAASEGAGPSERRAGEAVGVLDESRWGYRFLLVNTRFASPRPNAFCRYDTISVAVRFSVVFGWIRDLPRLQAACLVMVMVVLKVKRLMFVA